MLSGTAGGIYLNWNVSFPLDPPLTRDTTVFAIYNDSGVVFDSGDFSQDGLTFYSNSYGSPRNTIWKWTVLNGLASSGTNLTAAASFASPTIARIRSINAYRIGGADLVFYGEGGGTSGKVCVYDFATETETLLVTATVTDDIMNVKVSGIGLSQMHLHLQMDDGSVQIYELAADGLSVGDVVASFSASEMNTFVGRTMGVLRGYEISNDERFAYIDDFANTVCVLWTPEADSAWRPPANRLWWESPVLKYQVDITLSEGSHYMNKDESDQWLVVGSVGSASYNTYLFSLPQLRAAPQADEVSPLAVAKATNIGLGLSPGFRGGALSDDLRLYLSGAYGANGYAALPATAPWTAAAAVGVTNDTGVIFDSADFSHDSAHLFSNSYGSPRNKIWKWNVLGKLAAGGVNLTSNAVIVSSSSRVRSINAYHIGGKDLVYAGEGGNATGEVYVYDFDAGTETLLVTVPEVSDIMNVKVGGVVAGRKGGSMHLYVQFDNGAIYIYRLNAGGKSVGELVRHFTPAQTLAFLGDASTSAMRSFEVSDDETHAFIAHHGDVNRLHVVWTTPRRPPGKVIPRPWYDNTVKKYTVDQYRRENPFGDITTHLNKDESDQFLLFPMGWTMWSEYFLYSIPNLRAARTAAEVSVIATNRPKDLYPAVVYGPTFRAGAVSDELDRILSGFCYSVVYADFCVSLPTSGNWQKDVNVFSISNDVNAATTDWTCELDFDYSDFSHDSQFVWATQFNYGWGTERNLYKWRVLGGLAANGVGLVSNHVFRSDNEAISCLDVYTVHGRDLAFYSAGAKVCVYDPARERETTLINTGLPAGAVNVKVCGLARGLPHLYVQPSNQGLFIYELAPDCLSVRRLVKSFTEADLTALADGYADVVSMAIEVTDDEKYFFYSGGLSGYLNPLHVFYQLEVGSMLMVR